MNNSQVKHATKENPCPHCGKPDWCYRIGELSVCNRDAQPASGWKKTSKKDGDGHYFYAPIEEKKAPRPKQKRAWEYPDRDGNPLVRVVRTDDGTGKKKVWQERWNGKSWVKGIKGVDRSEIPIYRYKDVRSAISVGEPVFIVEGETCADALWKLGIAATTNIGGSGKWKPSDTGNLSGAKVILCPDRDTPGVKHMEKIASDFPEARWVYAYPDSGFWNNLPDSQGLDVADWIQDYKLDCGDIGEHIEPKRDLKSRENQDGKKEEAQNNKFSWVCAQVKKIHEIACPGERKWELGKLAKKLKTSTKSLMDCYESARQNLPSFERIDIQELLATTPERFDWLIAGLMPKGTTALLYAAPGTGKTLFTNSIVKAVAGGTDWNGYPTKQGKVLYVQTDEPQINTAHNLKEAGFGAIPTENLSLVFNWQFGQIILLEEAIQEMQPQLVVIDSLTSCNRNATTEEKDVEYARNLYELRDLAMKYGCAIIVLHHENKTGGVRGSTAIKANVSEVWHLTKTKELTPEHRLLEIEKSRAGCVGTRQLLLEPMDLSWSDQGDFDPRHPDGDAPTQVLPIKARLLVFLQEHPGVKYEAVELESEFGSRNTIRSAFSKLYKNGLIERETRIRKLEKGNAVKYMVYFVPEEISVTQTHSQQEIDTLINPADHADQTSNKQHSDQREDHRVKTSQGEGFTHADHAEPKKSGFFLSGEDLLGKTVAHRTSKMEEYHWHGTVTEVSGELVYVIWDESSEEGRYYYAEHLRDLGESEEQRKSRQDRMRNNGEGRFSPGTLF